MQDIKSREVRLVSHPSGIPTAANFTVAETMLEAVKDQEVVVRNLFMSVDPYMRRLRMASMIPARVAAVTQRLVKEM